MFLLGGILTELCLYMMGTNIQTKSTVASSLVSDSAYLGLSTFRIPNLRLRWERIENRLNRLWNFPRKKDIVYDIHRFNSNMYSSLNSAGCKT